MMPCITDIKRVATESRNLKILILLYGNSFLFKGIFLFYSYDPDWFFLYSIGDIPVAFLKVVEKVFAF